MFKVVDPRQWSLLVPGIYPDPMQGLTVVTCPGQSMLVLCRALECFFCWHNGVLGAGVFGGWRVPRGPICPRGSGGASSLESGPWKCWQLCSQSPGRKRANQAGEGQPATWPLHCKGKREVGDESRGSEAMAEGRERLFPVPAPQFFIHPCLCSHVLSSSWEPEATPQV